MLRSFGSWIAICTCAAALAACSPPAATAPTGEARAPSAASEPTAQVPGSDTSRRSERARASSAGDPATAQFKYIDESGKVRLASRIEDIPERQRSTASPLRPPAPAARSKSPFDSDRAVQNADVTIFTTRSCGYCRAALAHFDQSGIEYVNRDVEEDEEARAEYLDLTGGRRGVPVIVVGDGWMQGWSRPEFDRLLAAAR